MDLGIEKVMEEMTIKANQINTKLRTKGRFHLEIPTNGTLDRKDREWHSLANPQASQLQQKYIDIDMK